MTDFNAPTVKLGRLTGLFYLLIILGGLFGGLVARGQIVDYSDASATLQNLIEMESLYRMGFLGDLVMVISDVMVSVLFYYLLRDVHKGIALLAAVFRLMQSAILGANLINLFKPILMIKEYKEMDTVQLISLESDVLTQLQVFDYGYLISGVFFAVNCGLMAYLLFHSRHFPRILGILIGLAAFGYFFNCMANFVLPALIDISQTVMFFTAVIAELVLCVYLVVKGIKT